METITATIEAAGATSPLCLKPEQSATYTAVETDFVGVLYFERSRTRGQSWEAIETATDAGLTGGVVTNNTKGDELYRFRATLKGVTEMSGSLAVSVAVNVATLYEYKNSVGEVVFAITDEGITTPKATIGGVASGSGLGATSAATVTATERGNGVQQQTVLTLTDFPVTVANTTGASFGGAEVYGFPAGRILVQGVTADLDFVWTGTDIAAAGSGDFSMGSTITEDTTLDGTDVDLLPSTGLTDPFVLGVGAATGALAASAQFDGTTTALTANLNMIIDDADVADAASDIVLVSGTITLTWINLGDY